MLQSLISSASSATNATYMDLLANISSVAAVQQGSLAADISSISGDIAASHAADSSYDPSTAPGLAALQQVRNSFQPV